MAQCYPRKARRTPDKDTLARVLLHNLVFPPLTDMAGYMDILSLIPSPRNIVRQVRDGCRSIEHCDHTPGAAAEDKSPCERYKTQVFNPPHLSHRVAASNIDSNHAAAHLHLPPPPPPLDLARQFRHRCPSVHRKPSCAPSFGAGTEQ